ncbi:galactose oxidase [Ancylomarina sp. DW003]|nr:galactose oxidase [Ancylomarina sp. DW003]MDE5421466.1 galactose oxidase [Ancylomarina sp. DW003]
MKQRLLFAFFALSLFFTGCGSDNGLDGNWIKGSSFEGRPRGGAVSFVIGDNVYVGTGYDGKDALKTFYKYSLQEGWSKISDFPGTARREAVAFTANGKGYVGTGVDEDDNRLADFYEYTPASDSWVKVPNDFTGGARQNAVAFSINNIGYVGTGYGWQEGEDRNNLKDFYKFENGNWTKIAFDGEKSRNATTFVINDKAYVVSGDNSLKYVWEYDPATVSGDSNGWTSKKYLDDDNNREDVQRSEAVSFVINNKGYIVTGKIGGYSREVWEYEPTTDKWVERTSLEDEVRSREDAVAFTLSDRGFFTTGSASGIYLDDTWEFNPTMKETDDDN